MDEQDGINQRRAEMLAAMSVRRMRTDAPEPEAHCGTPAIAMILALEEIHRSTRGTAPSSDSTPRQTLRFWQRALLWLSQRLRSLALAPGSPSRAKEAERCSRPS